MWTNRYNGPGNGNDLARAIASDPGGNVIVTGDSAGVGSSADFATIAYSSAGVPLWTNRYNGPANSGDSARAIALDGSGKVFVAGYSLGTGGLSEYATIAYSSAGVPLWTNLFNEPGDSSDQATAIALDKSGNVFVTGHSTSFGTSQDYATIAYSGAGVPLWTNLYNGPGNSSDQATAIAVDSSGNVFVTGFSIGSGGSDDYATLAYSNAGVPSWTSRYNGPGDGPDQANAIAVDGSGNVFVTGSSTGPRGSDDYATIKYSGAGVPMWTNRYSGPGSNDVATAIALDSSGNVFVTGYSLSSSNGYDYATIKYSGAGPPLWTNLYNGPGNGSDQATGVAVDSGGNVFVTGLSSGIGSVDYATIAYSGAGAPLWTNRSGSPNHSDRAQALVVDVNGNVIVTGYSLGSGSGYDYVTIKYSATPASTSVVLAVAVAGSQLQLSWPTNAGGWTLQSSPSLRPTAWADLDPQPLPQIVGTNYQVLLPLTSAEAFYRLRK